MKRVMMTVVAIMILCAIAGAVVLYKSDARAYELLVNCRKLDSSATLEAIMNVMGQPAKTVESEGRLFYYYPSPRVAAEPTYFVINKRSNNIVEIHCGEGHEIIIN